MTRATTLFDPSAHILDAEAVEEYLKAAFESDDAAFIADAIGVVARSRGMSALAEDTGLSRQTLYKALDKGGNPGFATILKVAHALGFRLVPERLPA
jgi:probable addiction module antidote protein